MPTSPLAQTLCQGADSGFTLGHIMHSRFPMHDYGWLQLVMQSRLLAMYTHIREDLGPGHCSQKARALLELLSDGISLSVTSHRDARCLQSVEHSGSHWPASSTMFYDRQFPQSTILHLLCVVGTADEIVMAQSVCAL